MIRWNTKALMLAAPLMLGLATTARADATIDSAVSTQSVKSNAFVVSAEVSMSGKGVVTWTLCIRPHPPGAGDRQPKPAEVAVDFREAGEPANHVGSSRRDDECSDLVVLHEVGDERACRTEGRAELAKAHHRTPENRVARLRRPVGEIGEDLLLLAGGQAEFPGDLRAHREIPPLAVDRLRLETGDLVLLTGFGAGMTWGSALIRW